MTLVGASQTVPRGRAESRGALFGVGYVEAQC